MMAAAAKNEDKELRQPCLQQLLSFEDVLCRCRNAMLKCVFILAYCTLDPVINCAHLYVGISLSLPPFKPCVSEDLIHLSLGHPELQMKSESCRHTAPGRIMHPVSYCSHYVALQYIISVKHHPNDALV